MQSSLLSKVIFIMAILVRSSSQATPVTPPPLAREEAYVHKKFGDERSDPYFWMRKRDSKEVLAYISEENKYADRFFKREKKTVAQFFKEMKSRFPANEASYPAKDGEYFYYYRFKPGKEHPIFCRKINSLKAREEIILDVNLLKSKSGYLQVSDVAVSANHQILAYALDTVGRRQYDIHFIDLKSKKRLRDTIKEVAPNLVWANDNKTLFYSKKDPETLRQYQVYRHSLGLKNPDVLVYEEKDSIFDLQVTQGLNRSTIFLVSENILESEVRYLSGDSPNEELKLFQKRSPKVEYSVDDGGEEWFILTNDEAQNFKIMVTKKGQESQKNWKEFVPHRKDVLLTQMLVMKDYLVLEEREKGLTQVEVIDRKTRESRKLSFPDEAYVVDLGENREYESSELRVMYESLVSPRTTYDVNLKNLSLTARKQDKVDSKFKSKNYQTKRVWITRSKDVSIPVTLLHSRKTKVSSQTPLLVYGYGSYGISMEPNFRRSVLSLVDRGFVFAIAHVRGGSEMGRAWYDDASLDKKRNTFYDFNAVVEQLHKDGISSPKHTYAQGGSAGGLLMGVIINERPELYHGILAEVPFVDALTTMLDDTIPLTTGEYNVWGNPNEKEVYEYIKTYSPYDNVKPQAYPNLFVTTGYHDSQVQYWEPTKWVAKLRKMNTGSSKILFKTDMNAGHGGKAGRYERLKSVAEEYAFLWLLEQGKLSQF